MKIISLVSSYRINGNTNRVVSLIEKQLLSIADKENIALEIEKVQLNHFDIKTCCGCRVCLQLIINIGKGMNGFKETEITIFPIRQAFLR